MKLENFFSVKFLLHISPQKDRRKEEKLKVWKTFTTVMGWLHKFLPGYKVTDKQMVIVDIYSQWHTCCSAVADHYVLIVWLPSSENHSTWQFAVDTHTSKYAGMFVVCRSWESRTGLFNKAVYLIIMSCQRGSWRKSSITLVGEKL